MRSLLAAGLGLFVVLWPGALARVGPPAGGGRAAPATAAPVAASRPAAGVARAAGTAGARAAAVAARASAAFGAAGGRAHAPAAPSAPSARRVALLRAAGVLRESAPRFTVSGVEHTPFELRKAGLPVLNRRGRVHRWGGAFAGVAGDVSAPAFAEPAWPLGREAVLALARAAAPGGVLRAQPRVQKGWFALDGATRPAWRVWIATARPLASWQLTLDARDGRVLSRVDLLRSATGTGDVHDPTPSAVDLTDLDGSGSLAGAFVRVYDVAAPEAFRPDLRFRFPVGDPRLVQTSVYWNATRAGRFGVERGVPAAAFPLLAYTNLHEPDGSEYNNAYYDPYFHLLVFGNGDGRVLANLGTDADVAVHEAGHHLFETLVTPEIAFVSDPVVAMHEGVADTVAALVNGDPQIGEATVPGRPALRVLANANRFPDDERPDDPHFTGLIYGGTNWSLRRLLGPKFSKVLLAGLPFLPTEPEALDYRRALLQGNRAANSGRLEPEIRAEFRRRGFPESGDPEYQGLLAEGVTERRRLEDDAYVYWVFGLPPGTDSVTFRTNGTGDVDLIVVNARFDPDDDSTYEVSARSGSDESVTITRFTRPSTDEISLGVVVQDYRNRRPSEFGLTARASLGAARMTLGGPPVRGQLARLDEIDLLDFAAAAGDRVRVEVTADDPRMDLLAGVIDSAGENVLAVDDDSGPGWNPLLQGAPIPSTGRYGVAVLAWYDDLNPLRSLGGYEVRVSRCANAGTDTDGDGAADACDDDDDEDGFVDGLDSAPLDPALCADQDVDGCDDCAGGAFDPFADGPDADADGDCDVADRDDDNDGCEDAVDPAPFAASPDVDLDFLGGDCDVCPLTSDPDQEDADGDGLGDACLACAVRRWTAPALEPPDQNPAQPALTYFPSSGAAPRRLEIGGRFSPAVPDAAVDPAASGAHLFVADARGVLADATVPPGARGANGCGPDEGWLFSMPGGVATWEYQRASGASASCPAVRAGVVESLRIEDRRGLEPGGLHYFARLSGAPLARAPNARAAGLRVILGLEAPAAGLPTAAALAGSCAEWSGDDGVTRCRSVTRRAGGGRRVLDRIECSAP